MAVTQRAGAGGLAGGEPSQHGLQGRRAPLPLPDHRPSKTAMFPLSGLQATKAESV